MRASLRTWKKWLLLSPTRGETEMIPSQKNKLGRVDLYVTAMSFGGVAIGNLFRPICELESDAMIQRAWDAGIRYYDTAPMYGHGLSELRIGHSLRRKNRDDFVLSSKVGRILKPKRRSEIDFGPWIEAAPFEMTFDYTFGAQHAVFRRVARSRRTGGRLQLPPQLFGRSCSVAAPGSRLAPPNGDAESEH